MNTKKTRSTFRAQPKIPGNTPPPIHYTNKAAEKFLIRRLLHSAMKRNK